MMPPYQPAKKKSYHEIQFLQSRWIWLVFGISILIIGRKSSLSIKNWHFQWSRQFASVAPVVRLKSDSIGRTKARNVSVSPTIRPTLAGGERQKVLPTMGPKYQPALISISLQVYNSCDPNMALDPSELKILKNTKFPPEFNQKVEIKKVNLEVLKQYVLRDTTYPATDCAQILPSTMCRDDG